MNKLVIVNDIVDIKQLSKGILFSFEEKNDRFSVNKLKIKVLKSTSLELELKTTDTSKFDLSFELEKGVKFHLFERTNGNQFKIQYHFELKEKSVCEVHKLHVVEEIREVTHAYLNGENAKFLSLLKTITRGFEKYDMEVEHLAKNTVSCYTNHGVNVEKGSLVFNVTGSIPKGMSGSFLDQKSRIVTYNEEECKISPKLLVEEEDVVANHSAYIGKFRDEELFYMMSRGISEMEATMLLTKGFLLGGLKKKEMEFLEKNLENIWR